MGFQIAQTIYWSGLSVWFGGVIFLVLAAPVVMRAVCDANPVLPDVLSVNLEGQHTTLLSGAIVARLIARLLRLEMVAAGVVLLAMVLQIFYSDLSQDAGWMAVVRSVLFLAALAVALIDAQVFTPRVNRSRAEYVEHADEPEVANPALDRFDAAGRQSMLLLFARLSLLFGVVLFSATITPKSRTAPVVLPPPAAHA